MHFSIILLVLFILHHIIVIVIKTKVELNFFKNILKCVPNLKIQPAFCLLQLIKLIYHSKLLLIKSKEAHSQKLNFVN